MASILLSSDVDEIIIVPITKMVGIIKLLADDPLQKPIAPVFSEEEISEKAKTTIKTVEMQKTIFNIGRLL